MDNKMMEQRKGIAIAGSIILDFVKTVDSYPEVGMLANIKSVTQSAGGCVVNTGIDLAVLDSELPIYAIGRVGNDEAGKFLTDKLQQQGLNIDRVKISDTAPTSFSDVISLVSGERTFFACRGANAEFSPEDVDIQSLECRILHIGYILLLDVFDQSDSQYGTVMARFLHDLQERGIKTSIDTVSDSTGNFAAKVIPALRYCDYVIINEIECCNIWNLPARDEKGHLQEDNIRLAMSKVMEQGVREKVIVHCPEAGFCLEHSGQFTKVPSFVILKEEIKGKVGAGDAFCAGSLYGLYHQFSDEQILEFAAATAACSLLEEGSTLGTSNKEAVLDIIKRRKKIANLRALV